MKAVGTGVVVALGLWSVACEPAGTEVTDRTLRVACGSCQLQVEEHSGCYWAAEIDGRVVPVSGPAIPADHDAHGPDGMCSMVREAVVSGTLYESHVSVTRFDLVPVEVPEGRPRAHEHVH